MLTPNDMDNQKLAHQKSINRVLEIRIAELEGQLTTEVDKYRDLLRKTNRELDYHNVYAHVAEFSVKFGLQQTEALDHSLPEDVTRFRLNFLLEELMEYAAACGFYICPGGSELGLEFQRDSQLTYNPEVAFDSLIDLVYVAFGDLFLRRLPFHRGWHLVHNANMAKERASSSDDDRSKRKHSIDVVKPAGWVAPDLSLLLDCNKPTPEYTADQLDLVGGGLTARYENHKTIDEQTGQQQGYVVLSEEERKKGFVRPLRAEYIHKACGAITKMATPIAETYARDPKFYNGTFCIGCKKHFPLDQFVWAGTEETVGS